MIRSTVIRFYSIVFFLFLMNSLIAQNGIFRGFIYDKSNGEPISYATIYVMETGKGVVSGENGYFSLTKIPAGDYTVRISFLGYDSLLIPLKIKENETINRNFQLQPQVVAIEGVQIVAQKEILRTETRVAAQHVTPKQITQLPSIGGTPDLAQYLQVLPGVVFTGDQGGQLYIRGGTPIQNKVLLDGLVIHNPFHSIGLFSVFDVDIIRSVDVYTAGFGAEYGGRTSSIIDVKTRDGNRKRHSGKVDINTFGAKLVLEGPFARTRKKKNDTLADSKNKKERNVSYLLSVKGSYLEQTSKVLYPYANEGNGLPYNYLDGYGKISIQTDNGSKVNLFGFSFNDAVKYPNIATYQWNSWGAGINFLFLPTKTNMIMDGTVAYSDYKIGLQEAGFSKDRTSRVNGFSMNLNFNYLLGLSSFKYGLELLGTWVDYQYLNPYGTNLGQDPTFNTELSAYVKYKWLYKKIILEPSIRFHYYASQSVVSPEPRLAFKYNITKNIRLKLAGGLYSQNLMGATSDQDVVNLFYGFLTVPEPFADSIGGRVVKNSLQKGQHAVVGLELDVIKNFSIQIEGYFKNFSQLTNVNRYQMFDFEDEFIMETGIAYGADVSVKYEYKKLYLYVAYSLNFVTRDDDVIIYRTHFDRRHNLNVVASYAFGKRGCWQIDARWNFGSGFPFTKTKGVYPKNESSSSINSDFYSQNEGVGFVLDDINKGQLPDYHRLDLNFKRKFFFTETVIMEVGAGVTNAYNYKNLFYINRATNEKIYQLPVLWSVNCNLTF